MSLVFRWIDACLERERKQNEKEVVRGKKEEHLQNPKIVDVLTYRSVL